MKIKILLMCCVLSVVAGCRIGVPVFEGGDVISESGTRHCFEGGTCEFTVEDALFTETFTATPRTGFEFTKWTAGDGFLCADSTDPVCTISLTGDAISQAVVASEGMFYLMPEFTCVVEYDFEGQPLRNCPERPDPNWRALDEAIVALEDAREIIEAYVITNGTGATVANDCGFEDWDWDCGNDYGIPTWIHNSTMLHSVQLSPSSHSGPNSTFYITARVYKAVWEGGELGEISGFSLSGETNADNSITWRCVPKKPGETYVPNGPNAIPEPYLPIDCRG